MAKHKLDYWVGRMKGDYYFSPLGVARPAVTLEHQDWVDVKIYPNLGVADDVTFAEVRFKDVADGSVKAVWKRTGTSTEGSWTLQPGGAEHYRLEDTAPEPSGAVRGVRISNNEQLASGVTDAHEFEIHFSDGGCLDPELINRG